MIKFARYHDDHTKRFLLSTLFAFSTIFSGIVSSFELRCDVQQNLISAPERPTVRINIKKSYDDGNLTAGTIGIIVGVVVAVILAVIAIALVFISRTILNTQSSKKATPL